MNITHPSYPLFYRMLGGETSFAATERMQQQRIQKDEGTRSLNAQIQTLQVNHLILNFMFTTLAQYEVTPSASLIILTNLFIFLSLSYLLLSFTFLTFLFTSIILLPFLSSDFQRCFT
jgi:hypothetical protein